jgi:hypothetical protein
MKNRISVAIAIFLFLSISLNSHASESSDKRCENTSNKALFVLDISGSMQGKPLNQAKATIAGHLETLPSKFKSGLMTFNGCGQDTVKLEVPVAANNASTIISRLNTISATGSTAIEQALQKAESALSGERTCTNIVLLTDGKDSCGGSPVRAADSLKNQCQCVNVITYNVDDWDQEYFDRFADNMCSAYNEEQLETCFSSFNKPEKAEISSRKKDGKKSGSTDDDDDDDTKPYCRPGQRYGKSCKCKKRQIEKNGTCQDPDDPKTGEKTQEKARSGSKSSKKKKAGSGS